MRQIILDTETTGLEAQEGHRIIEIGCVELLNRRLTDNRFHYYLNPDREIDEAAIEVHGLTKAFLADKPRFADIASALLDYIRDAELIIHNAPFDIGFLDAEFMRVFSPWDGVPKHCRVLDTLALARQAHPGQKNSLDALCKRYHVDNTQRTLHGALLDAEILADVYLAMTGGQGALSLETDRQLHTDASHDAAPQQGVRRDRSRLAVIQPNQEEQAAHQAWLRAAEARNGQPSVWRKLELESG